MTNDSEINLHATVQIPVKAGPRHGVVVLQPRLQCPHLPVNDSTPLVGDRRSR